MSYHEGTKVHFTPKAYLNRPVNELWCGMWKEWKEEHLPGQVLLTCDNVDSQTLRSFQKAMEQAETRVLHGSPVQHTYGKQSFGVLVA